MSHDPGHLLPDDEWRAVVADAEAEAERIRCGISHPTALVPVEGEIVTDAAGKPLRFGTGLGVALDGQVVAARHGGSRPPPTFGVLHSAETPLRAGYAASIARMFATTTRDASCHYMTDPAETWGVLDDLLVAWHCGNGNTNSIGLEQAGYARFTRAEWLVPDGWAQMRRNAEIMRAAKTRFGIGLWWMTDAELLRAHRREIVGGWATHDQCRRVLGGTDHTDPMPNFPLAEQMALASTDDEGLDMAAIDLLNEIVRELRGPDRKGWVGRRLKGARPQITGTMVDYLAEIDRELNSTIDSAARASEGKRPTVDTLFGHVVSTRAEVGLLRAELAAAVAKLGGGAA